MVAQLVLLAFVALSGVVTGGAWSGALASVSSLLGLGLMLAGALLLGRGLMDLGANLTPLPYPRDDSRLVETGVYALVRHPLYGGLVVTSFGWAMVSTSLVTLLLAFVVLLFFDLKSRREEVWLAQRFAGYEDYRRRTRRLVPWIY